MMCDLLKSMGHKVKIVTRGKRTDTVLFPIEKVIPIRPEFVETLPPERRMVMVKTGFHLFQYSLENIRRFQPIRHLATRDISLMDIPMAAISGFYVGQFPEEVKNKVNEADYIFVDTELYIKLPEALPVEGKQIQYVHFPPTNIVPVKGKEPVKIWVNSRWTKRWVKKRWGVTSWERTEVVNPPLYVDDYDPNPGFEDRPYDCVMFARLGPDKFGPAPYLNKRYKLLTMGSQGKTPEGMQGPPPFNPEGELHKNLTIRQIAQLLSQAKVYIHGKGFGRKPPQSLGEHFGLSACEAASSKCALVVPRKGGIWTDVADHGKYALGYNSYKELDKHVSRLISDRDYWEEWSQKALDGVQRFDAERIKERIEELLV